MPYPSIPEARRKRGIGLSLDDLTARRIEALAGGPGKRSEFIREHLEVGMVVQIGPDWQEKADRILATETEAA